MTQTKDEALKLALEALRTERDIYRENDDDGAPEYIIEAITAIKAALAAQPAQEPVAWALQEEDGQIYDCICNDEHDRHEGRYTVPLYTTPQQRPWVGLVNKDKVLDFGDAHVTTEFARGALWAEAKLKELNT
jgi:hypothetical protein